MNRFVILDDAGMMLNRIATDETEIAYAGYGHYVAYEGDGDIPAVTTEAPWQYLSVKPDMPMCQRDTMDIATGHVTPAPPPPPEPEQPIEEPQP